MITPKKKVTPIRRQYQKCFDLGLAAITPNYNRKAYTRRLKKARREFNNFLEKNIPIDEALKRSLAIAAGAKNARYQTAISVALSHIPTHKSWTTNLYQQATKTIANLHQKLFGKYSIEIRSGYKYPGKI